MAFLYCIGISLFSFKLYLYSIYNCNSPPCWPLFSTSIQIQEWYWNVKYIVISVLNGTQPDVLYPFVIHPSSHASIQNLLKLLKTRRPLTVMKMKCNAAFTQNQSLMPQLT